MDTSLTSRSSNSSGVQSQLEPPPLQTQTQTQTQPQPQPSPTYTTNPTGSIASPLNPPGRFHAGIPPTPQPDPAQSFLWGAQNLFAALNAMNHKIDSMAFNRNRSDEELRRRLESVRNFALSIYRQLQTHNDYVRGERFIAGVEEAAGNVVVTKCLPEIWKLRANVDEMKMQVKLQAEKTKQQGEGLGLGLSGNVRKGKTGSVAANAALQAEVEGAVLRLAALGEERIQHIEIIGNGKRYKDGTSIRRIVTEDELGKGSYSHLGVPAQWKGHSDAKTINSNFKQITTMFNDVLLPRLDAIEKTTEARLDRLDKRVTILQGLFATLNSCQRQQQREREREGESKPIQRSNEQEKKKGDNDTPNDDHKLQGTQRSPGDEAPRKRYSAKPGRAAFIRSKSNAAKENETPA